MATASVGTHQAYGGTNGEQCFLFGKLMTLESNILERSTQSTLLHVSTNIIQYQWIRLGGYIVEVFWIGTINKYMPTCLCHYMWIVTYMNINTKLPHASSIHHKNENYQVTGPKLSVRQTKGTKLSSHLSTEKYKNVVGNSLYYARAFNPTMMVSLVKVVASQSKLIEDTN